MRATRESLYKLRTVAIFVAGSGGGPGGGLG